MDEVQRGIMYPEKEIIEKLMKLKNQVDLAIDLINTRNYQTDSIDGAMPERGTPNRIEIGDFVITDRFQEPRFEK